MKKIFKLIGIIALVAVIGFSMACSGGDDGGGTGGGGGGGGTGGTGGTEDVYVWRFEKQTNYTVNNGVVEDINFEIVPEWLIYVNEHNYQYKAVYTIGSNINTYKVIWNNEIAQIISETSNIQEPLITNYDPETGLIISQRGFYNYDYINLLLIEDSDLCIYKHFESSNNGNGSYKIYTQKNGLTIKEENYTSENLLSDTIIYLFPNNDIISKKLPEFTIRNQEYVSFPNFNWYETVNIILDSNSELLIRITAYQNGILYWQYDNLYKNIKL